MNNRRKYDVTDKDQHEKLWDKWQLESAEFFAVQDETETNSQVELTTIRG